MSKEPKDSKENVEFSLEFTNVNQLIQAMMAYRVALYNADGGRMIAIPVVLAVIVALIMPKVIAFLAVVALFRGIRARLVRHGAIEQDDGASDDATQDDAGEAEKFKTARESLAEKVAPKRLTIDVDDQDDASSGDSLRK